MLSLLRTGRWQAFTAAAVVAIVAFGLLSVWQWHRAEQKRLEFETVERSMISDPVAAADVVDPPEWLAVTATGEYVPESSLLVRNQPQDGTNGFWVLTLLDSEPADLWVVRGWTAVELAAGKEQVAPPPPTGPVTVTGFARRSEPGPLRAGSDLPAAQVSTVDIPGLDAATAATSQPWFLIAADDPLLRPVTPPEPSDSRNLSYAGQWLLFAIITIGGWYYFLRREAQDDAARSEAATAPPAHSTSGA